jgi:aminoglycoside 3-N-acetyltransferase
MKRLLNPAHSGASVMGRVFLFTPFPGLPNMKHFFDKVLAQINTTWLMNETDKLTHIELGQSFSDYHKAADYAANLARQAGLQDCQILHLPADGKTAYQDKRMPMAWNATQGRLTIPRFGDPVVADYQRHPFHLVKGSTSTPPDGLDVRIITENQLFAGQEARGRFVMLNPFTPARAKVLSALLDLGAIGFITDNVTGRYETPSGLAWVNACTEGNHWHIQADDRDFIGFVVSPIIGQQIRTAAEAGELLGHVQCDGVRSVGTLPIVTALLPGRQKRELWMFAHLYEPLIDDNNSGVTASIEIARVIKKLTETGQIPPLEFSLRVVFTMEFYGFAGFAELMGGALHEKTIGCINNDALPITTFGDNFHVYLAPPGSPFFGNALMEKLTDEYTGQPHPSLARVIEEGFYTDDAFLSDPTTGLPTVWPIGVIKLHHNSEQKLNIINPVAFARSTAFAGAWTAGMLTINADTLPAAVADAAALARKHLAAEAGRIIKAYSTGNLRIVTDLPTEIRQRMAHRLQTDSRRIEDFRKVADIPLIAQEVQALSQEADRVIAGLERQLAAIPAVAQTIKSDKWFEFAATITPARAKRGMPYDLADVPKEDRVPLPENMIYGPFSRVLANMDGEKNLQTLIRETEWEADSPRNPGLIKKYVNAVSYLTDHGYLRAKYSVHHTREDITRAIKAADIGPGDLVLVHSSLSSFGRVPGGPQTVIDAVLDAIGPAGTALFPTFTRPYIHFDGETAKGQAFRPYDPDDHSQIWTGSIPKAFVKRPGVIRSAHPSHSVAAIGPLAAQCLLGHLETDAPTSRSSPFGKLLDHAGKILYLGCGLAPSTFLHLIEDEANLAYLGNALCAVKCANGDTRTVLVPKHLPGHRDFYTSDALGCKFFKAAIAAGLPISQVPLGMANIQMIDAKAFYDVGMKVTQKDPNIFLCNSPKCLFCAKFTMKLTPDTRKA